MKLKSTKKSLLAVYCAALLAGVAPFPAHAVFDAGASPPRFELKAKPGDVMRQIVRIVNGAKQPARYGVKTADWVLDEAGSVQFLDGIPGEESCRPWVRIERHTISVPPEGSREYRFEIHVPPDAKPGECRFALLVSSEAGSYRPNGASGIEIPIVGRLGVIVYVAIGEARPELDLVGFGWTRVNGKLAPAATFHNKGSAHGRVFGSLEAKDALGRKIELVAEQGAVLPNARKTVVLNPTDWSSGEPKTATFELVPPMHVRGKLQFLGGGEVSIDQVLREERPTSKPRTRQALKEQ